MKPLIEQMEDRLRERLPSLVSSVDRPDNQEAGHWFLDCSLNEHPVIVEWRPGRGFGISARSNIVFGEGPDEVYESLDEAFERVLILLMHRRHTLAFEELSLGAVRRAANISQTQLAARLDVTQATVSKMENRADMFIGTLRAAIEAMGGELELRAVFPEAEYRLSQVIKQSAGGQATARGKRRSGKARSNPAA